MTSILYISDNDIRLQKSVSDERIIRSQGYAWFKGSEVIFDTDQANAPIKYCRLAPQQMNNRYWSQCEKTSVASNTAGMRHAADLIWKHLSELQKQHNLNDVILLVPSHYQSSNLQLLLGIFQSLDITVVGLANAALMSLEHQLTQAGDYLHIDVQLHQTVCSHIQVNNGLAKLGDIDIIQSVGIQAIQDALLKTLQTSFIQNDRFDPLHYAETEQQLFNVLPDVAVQINESGKALVKVEYQGQSHGSSVDAKIWNAALAPFLNELVSVAKKADKAFVQLNAAFGNNAVSTNGNDNITLLEPLILDTLPAYLTETDDNGSLSYITEIKVKAVNIDSTDSTEPSLAAELAEPKQVPDTPKATPNNALTGATHLLQAGIAVPIEHCHIAIEAQQLRLHTQANGNAQSMLANGKLFVMGDESCKEFRPNDRIGSHFAEGVLTVIQVV